MQEATVHLLAGLLGDDNSTHRYPASPPAFRELTQGEDSGTQEGRNLQVDGPHLPHNGGRHVENTQVHKCRS